MLSKAMDVVRAEHTNLELDDRVKAEGIQTEIEEGQENTVPYWQQGDVDLDSPEAAIEALEKKFTDDLENLQVSSVYLEQ